ncbi:MAG: PLDc N-terminal domain-containing protein [Dictyoglomus sp.]
MDFLSQNFTLLLPLILMQVIFQIIALVDLIKRGKGEIRGENKLVWGIIIIVFGMLGPILYFILGRN